MKFHSFYRTILVTFFVCLGVGFHAHGDNLLRAGIGVRSIVPEQPGFHMSGYFSERVNTGVHDPLQAKAIVLEQDDTRVALVFCDLIGVIREVTDAARARIAAECSIPVSHSVIAATHTHTGPLYYGVWQRYYEQKHGQTEDADLSKYKAYLSEQIGGAVSDAAAALSPVNLRHGFAIEDSLSFNRRFFMRDGTVRFNPGRMNPKAIRPAGPIDPQVGLIAFSRSGADRPHALLTTFSLHLDTVGGLEFSADYPYHLEQRLREELGDSFASVFGTGPCGDVNHIDTSQNLSQKGHEEAGRIGRTLADTILAHLSALRQCETPHLAMLRAVTAMPLQSYTPEELAWAEAEIGTLEDRDVPFLERVKIRRIIDLAMRGSDTVPVEVQALRLCDDAAIVFLPGEIFIELGLSIKASSPFADTLVVELSNDNPAYVPTAKAFAEGSYEVENSRVAPGAGEQIAEMARRLLYQLKFAAE
ncbi:MAG TPA: hypothetical protein ENN29_01980 [Candidatus Hydrogenedentes bacterium]|nr:hypothetical protein [Candidatus Hydrogenedentota bacterium]